MTLENKLKQIENELVNAQKELENTTKRLEEKEKTLTAVSNNNMYNINMCVCNM